MTNMEERFRRAFDVLVENSNTWSEEDYQKVLKEGLNLMWLRNEANLWEDYVEDKSWVINGIHYDPNHPDNLSHSVYMLWRSIYGE